MRKPFLPEQGFPPKTISLEKIIFKSRNTESQIDAKAKAELAAKAKASKGPLNTGTQGIKKSGKK